MANRILYRKPHEKLWKSLVYNLVFNGVALLIGYGFVRLLSHGYLEMTKWVIVLIVLFPVTILQYLWRPYMLEIVTYDEERNLLNFQLTSLFGNKTRLLEVSPIEVKGIDYSSIKLTWRLKMIVVFENKVYRILNVTPRGDPKLIHFANVLLKSGGKSTPRNTGYHLSTPPD